MEFLNIAVVNNSGNVGKSTLCEVLLKPRLEGAEVIKVETINSDGSDDVKFSASEFNEILKKIDASDVSIIDVGSSNIESFLLQMQEYKDSHEDIDYFIIPVIPKHKQQVDAVSTASMLIDMGVEKERLRFVFNQADKKLTIEKQFPDFLKGLKINGIKLKKYSVVYETQAFSMLNKMDKKFSDIVNDDRDFRALLRAAESREAREAISEERSLKRLVSGVNDDLETAFIMLDIK
ncbi:StbB family protein [Vibrio vulnificus]|uniref:StbB family protein n=1 Tax=Vibrio vulnificus TaxID=672 RepID=UPI00405837C9